MCVCKWLTFINEYTNGYVLDSDENSNTWTWVFVVI